MFTHRRPSGKEVSVVQEYLQKATVIKGLIVDTPQHLFQTMQSTLHTLSETIGPLKIVEMQTSRLGSFFARRRWVWLYGDCAKQSGCLEGWTQRAHQPLLHATFEIRCSQRLGVETTPIHFHS